MRIGINCRTILNPGFGEGAGVGHYTYYLVKTLLRLDQANEYYLYFDELVNDKAVEEVTGNLANAVVRRFPFHQYKKFMPFAYSHLLVTSFLANDALDVFHAPSGILPYTYKKSSVITIHDLAIYKHPEWFPKNRISKAVSTKMLVPKSVEAANTIIAVSESTKKDIIELFGVSPEKIEVIYEGVELPGDYDNCASCALSQPIRKKYDIKKEYFFSIGTLEPRKNITLVLEALEAILKTDPEILKEKEYIIAGVKGWRFEDIFNKITEVNNISQEKNQEALVRYIGYIPHADKFPLMAGSLFFAFPSLYEGFGLPVLEAMKMGVPVITSDVSSIPEVCGEAAKMIDPASVEQMKKSIIGFISSSEEREKYGNAAKAQAEKFSWEETARQTLVLYKKLQ